jgi:aspartyl-tRNA(Asn)/glutamyl-tRNA(Gln) amidotransferase subunit A
MAIVLQAISGKDPRDGTTADVPVPDYLSEIKKPLKVFALECPKNTSSQA